MSITPQTRLTLDVAPHPHLLALQRAGDELKIVGEVKVTGTFPVAKDLNHGDELVVTIAGADGEVLSHGLCTIAGPPPLVPIESKELGLIGYCRSHKAKVHDAQARGGS